MACMEHHCMNFQCDWFEMDNELHDKCPKCGAKVRSYFDEENDHYPDPRKEYEEEENDDNS